MRARESFAPRGYPWSVSAQPPQDAVPREMIGKRSRSNEAGAEASRQRLMEKTPLERMEMALRLYAQSVAIAKRIRGQS